MEKFFEMGGYGGYIWPAYGVSAAVLALLAFSIWRRGRTLAGKLKRENAHNAGEDR